jgi:uncharacterized protein (TIGR02246 family)
MCPESDKQLEKDLEAIQRLHESDWKASKQFDFDTLITLWTDDGVLLQPNKKPIIGKKALFKYLRQEFKQTQNYDILEYRHDFQEVKITGDWAYEWGTFYGKVRMHKDGKLVNHQARLLRILKRQTDGSWKCARAIWHELPAE